MLESNDTRLGMILTGTYTLIYKATLNGIANSHQLQLSLINFRLGQILMKVDESFANLAAKISQACVKSYNKLWLTFMFV